jgi:E3 ubiquitin-protein ligase DOA10
MIAFITYLAKTVEEIKQLLDRYPYLTLLTYGGVEYVGIVQNADEQITTIYDFSALKTTEQKVKFLELGDVWWWESNRIIPINVFLKQDWVEFKAVVKTMNSKDVVIEIGPQVSLKEMSQRRSKRRSITLVRRVG